jgi:tRNA (cytidine56-2'-O)-methyltransferase
MIITLRIGHRKERDKRISTHIGLMSRAFLADKIIYSGEHDESLISSVNKVSKSWGEALVQNTPKTP